MSSKRSKTREKLSGYQEGRWQDTGWRAKRRILLDVGKIPLIILHATANSTASSFQGYITEKNQTEKTKKKCEAAYKNVI